VKTSLSILTAIFPGGRGLAGIRILELRVMEVCDNWSCTTRQSSSQIITTNKSTPVFTGRMSFLTPNQQCQSTEGWREKIY